MKQRSKDRVGNEVYLSKFLQLLIFLSMTLNPSRYYADGYYWKCRKMYGTYNILVVFIANLSSYLNCADLLSFDSAQES